MGRFLGDGRSKRFPIKFFLKVVFIKNFYCHICPLAWYSRPANLVLVPKHELCGHLVAKQFSVHASVCWILLPLVAKERPAKIAKSVLIPPFLMIQKQEHTREQVCLPSSANLQAPVSIYAADCPAPDTRPVTAHFSAAEN